MTRYVRIGNLKMPLSTQPEPPKPKRTRKPKAEPKEVVLENFDDPIA